MLGQMQPMIERQEGEGGEVEVARHRFSMSDLQTRGKFQIKSPDGG